MVVSDLHAELIFLLTLWLSRYESSCLNTNHRRRHVETVVLTDRKSVV